MGEFDLMDLTEDQVGIILIALKSYQKDLYEEIVRARQMGEPSMAYHEWLDTSDLIEQIEYQISY